MQRGRHQAAIAVRTRGTVMTLTSLTLAVRSSDVVATTRVAPVQGCSVSTSAMALPAATTVSAWSCPYFDVTSHLVPFNAAPERAHKA